MQDLFPLAAFNQGLSVTLKYSEQLDTDLYYTIAPTEAESPLNNFSLGLHPQRKKFFNFF